ncbi:hypothetical protein GGS23DRAFT_614106 [Durotheca rogersii]|uniref:uncharacterized protein n=1 Tax=Durotheca rogersii TaxID=419775 RepID=UPI0022210D0B|nr:uncharacterized protein GGS23DRAFT_614106 [Durotheca rogersii]KAI5860269.1 hypothetical protein GGS23DRAFT_614106 [Durotheca rogersii]
MADTRQSAFMPTIKCSNCGSQVEISLMGEHVCNASVLAAEPSPPMPDLLGGTFSSLKQSVFDKLTRAPPTVDTSAANNAFKLDQLTPVSASTGSHSISPQTPTAGRLGADPSGDDYAPAIAGSPRRPGGYGGFRDSGSSEGESAYGTSPNKQSHFLTRMNTIAPGPFEGNRRPGAKEAFARNNSRDFGSESNNDSLHVGYSLERPGTAGSTSSNRSGGMAPPRAPRKNGYGGFGPPQRESDDFEPQPLGLGKRSETFPEKLVRTSDEVIEAPARVPSAPGPRPDRLQSMSSSTGDRISTRRSQRPSFGPQEALRPPPRSSLVRPPTRDGNTIPINLDEEFGVNNPYHSPSISQSSSTSGYSHMSQPPSQASSNTSPARSVGSRGGVRQPSDMSGVDALLDDLQSSMGALQTKGQPPSLGDRARIQRAPSPLNPSHRHPSPETRRPDPVSLTGREPDLRSGPPVKTPLTPDSSEADRRDPAVQEGRSGSPPERVRPQHSRQPSRSRGNCRGCGKPITGKSISSADGRLTGRYHKACFVCTTCQEPFSSATFYVLNDKPYCEQHYHKLNGSLCGTCNRGIEGQYLEDESSIKYHPHCFRCGDCGVVLRDGYFDVNGKSYCERDAWRRVQSAIRDAQRMQQHQQPSPNTRTQQPSPRPSGQAAPPPMAMGGGLPAGPGSKLRPLNQPFGLPTGNRLAPGQALGRGGLRPIPKMEKRMTRFGMM